MNDFVNKTLTKQQTTRDDIRSLGERIDKLCTQSVADSKRLQKLLDFQDAQNEREERLTTIAEGVAKTLQSIVPLIEDMHRRNNVLTELLEGLSLQVRGDAAMERMIDRMDKTE